MVVDTERGARDERKLEEVEVKDMLVQEVGVLKMLKQMTSVWCWLSPLK